MQNILPKAFTVAAVGALAVGLYAAAAHAEVFKVTSIAPGMSPFVVNTAISKVVNRHLEDVEFQVNATGAATKHFVDAATGKADFLFGSPTINWLLANQLGPFKSFDNGAELEKQVGMIFSYQIGPYHYVTRADSGIESLEDLHSKSIFVGPPGGAARGVVLRAIEEVAGITPEDMDVQSFGFDAAIQAFQDDKIDVIVLPTNVPSPAIQQFALTKKIRILDVDVDKMTINASTGGTVNTLAPDAYGDSQVNQTPTRTHGAMVNFSAGMHVDEETVYQVTKAIWDHLDEIHETAQWLPNTITREAALELVAGRLHPGAERYYREQGWDIPEPVTFTSGN
ncbi:TAXI family TRAP transporter solute-binding subunit [Chelativorans alearense]|uniref:TAXI family TRAP transporter solute-binding subunit n=1 Tax=Chelativorans alearense TaxID=2681495 RepID=UPI0013D8BFD5|nr:TAXI family TRAP transporter solute-binding subunit [Chelativorans alearense]